ncbi:hypothetical protein [Blastococcus sp. TF02A-26]|uniref:hypothetical protein n=1 Tax=Blastococcus sp. TF02A-26 TaxID=2250577 RepID=UPI000DE8119D|nr:hypothetical protein [Blastococcus sp. TF02A-26]RBY85114.1 hypothetical protein DQ240_12850 [Blastococcus sp. TF02A-26]
MATLRLSRPRDGGGILRRLRVLVDDREVAALRQGESAAVPLPAGTYTVRGRMDWTRTPPLTIEVADDDEVSVDVALPFSAIWDMVRRPGRALTIHRR